MFKNFFRKVRATLKNSNEAIAIGAGLFGLGPIATPFINAMTSQYQDNPFEEMLGSTALSGMAGRYGRPLLNKAGVPGMEQQYDMFGRKVTRLPTSSVSNQGTRTSSFDQNPLAKVLNEADPDYGESIRNKLTKDKSGFGLSDLFTGLYDDESLTGKGKMIGSIASTLGPGLATYLALIGEEPEEESDAKEYRSAVDDYYSALARGENPNPADFGLAPTPAEDMVKGLRYNQITDSYDDVPAARAATGGLVGLWNGGDAVEEMQMDLAENPQGELLETLKIRERANAPRRRSGLGGMDVMENMSEEVVQAKTGGIIGLALGGNESLEKRGMVRGPGGPKEDKIPAMLSNGEFVMTAKAVDRAGGPKAMYNMMNKLDPESSRAPQSAA